MKPFLYLAFLTLLLSCHPKKEYTTWSEYLGGPERNHYTTLSQITPENVNQLQVVWTYEMPDSGQIQSNPIIVDSILYGITPGVQVFALNAATGKEIWRFGDPLKAWHSTGRGVAYWTDGKDRRIFHTIGPRLYCLDALTGQPVPGFGENGSIDLHEGFPEVAKDKFIISNTPGTIYKDLIIMPVRVSEGSDAAPGDIRAFDVRSGKIVWTFHTIPHPGEAGYETFPEDAWQNTYVGAANCWAGMSVDRQRGMLFVPTGSAAYDFYGGYRKGKNLYADCLLALDAATGKLTWYYQFTHHDIWDRDLPAPPNLLQVNRNGKIIDAVAQVTKQGYVFVFNRETGEPMFNIREVPAPASAIPGEEAWASQPIPDKPAPFARQVTSLTENDIPAYIANRDSMVQQFRAMRKEFLAPPSAEGTLLFPGFDGGAEWGGAAADPESGVLYVNANEMAWVLQMVEAPKSETMKQMSPGAQLYTLKCAACHGPNREGNTKSGYPELATIEKRRDRLYVGQLIGAGKGMMPGFSLTKTEKGALIGFLFHEEKGGEQITAAAADPRANAPYKSTGYNKFLDANGLPAFSPPYGTLTAIDLNSGEQKWRIPLGEDEALRQKGVEHSGTENYGGAIVTQNGLLLIAATKDGKFRAFNKNTGRLLWETTLPAAAFATPATYMVGGRQYIVLACGGTKLGVKKGKWYVAFGLGGW